MPHERRSPTRLPISTVSREQDDTSSKRRSLLPQRSGSIRREPPARSERRAGRPLSVISPTDAASSGRPQLATSLESPEDDEEYVAQQRSNALEALLGNDAGEHDDERDHVSSRDAVSIEKISMPPPPRASRTQSVCKPAIAKAPTRSTEIRDQARAQPRSSRPPSAASSVSQRSNDSRTIPDSASNTGAPGRAATTTTGLKRTASTVKPPRLMSYAAPSQTTSSDTPTRLRPPSVYADTRLA
ncbi:hypothetical protein LTS18_015154, partial [Coniosporium uncinatum]